MSPRPSEILSLRVVRRGCRDMVNVRLAPAGGGKDSYEGRPRPSGEREGTHAQHGEGEGDWPPHHSLSGEAKRGSSTPSPSPLRGSPPSPRWGEGLWAKAHP